MPLLRTKIDPKSPGHWTHRVWSAYHGAIHYRAATLGLTGSQAIVFGIIARLQPIAVRDITDLLGLSAPAVTRQVDSLEQLELVVRNSDEADERVKRLTVSQKGSELWPQVEEILQSVHRQALGGFDPDEERMVIHFLKRIERNLEQSK